MWRNQLLRDADWAGMAHSLEIRVPLIDVELFRRVVPLTTAGAPPSKRQMASAPRQPFPNAILQRQKTGFTVPVRDWLQEHRPVQTGAAPRTGRGSREWARFIFAANQRAGRIASASAGPSTFVRHALDGPSV